MILEGCSFWIYFYSHFSVNCQWASWGSWQSCSKSCGGGTQKRYRSKSVVAQNGGNECSGSLEETMSCNTNNCPGTYITYRNYTKQDFLIHIFHSHFSVNCIWGPWGPWSSCSKSCQTGSSHRSRSKLVVGNVCMGQSRQSVICTIIYGDAKYKANGCPRCKNDHLGYLWLGPCPGRNRHCGWWELSFEIYWVENTLIP